MYAFITGEDKNETHENETYTQAGNPHINASYDI